ncbi:MAG TPA: ubiquinol-cytochrome c reductase iron-sulfur subunit [Aquabacterium sp.]|nr:ubiquinol-cytochrome c reductase iron-sulfur subunit [Aquabacterium sp.]HSW09253.1 ubiquinol-cytochrome c reductase iron-sulfur subunit [Aquabacterium sp.]
MATGVCPLRRELLLSACAVGAAMEQAHARSTGLEHETEEHARLRSDAVEVDLSDLAPGQLRTLELRGQKVWVLRRTLDMISTIETLTGSGLLADPMSDRNAAELTPEYARNPLRSIKPDIFVAIAICSHGGCLPTARLQAGPNPQRPDNWRGGFVCPCHFSTWDLAGRVFKDKPALDNLPVPPHVFVGESRLVLE